MKNLKKKFRFRIHLKSKHLLAIMTFFCVSAIVATLASGVTSAPLKEAAGLIIVPFEKSIASIGQWMTGVQDSFREKEDLIQQNEELQTTVDTLTEQNNVLLQDQAELAVWSSSMSWMRNIQTIRRLLPGSFPKIPETGMIRL